MKATPHEQRFRQICPARHLIDLPQAARFRLLTDISGEETQVLPLEHDRPGAGREPDRLAAPVPATIAGFRLIRPLGRGGMGTVYLANQVSLGREVALKLMSPLVAADADANERFLREARAAATVNHPNVVSIIDVGKAQGQLYMALELVPGGDAGRLARRLGGALPERRALELLSDCAAGLQALHEARLVHRDLKPGNIFITRDGRAKLGDLGLARSADEKHRLTLVGNLVGTPAFMSPEQAGGLQDLDIRSDIYALGATLFALLTGRRPFLGNSPVSIAAKALTQPAPDPRSLVPGLSGMTADLVLRTMAKSPADRFQTPTDLRAALEQALEQAPDGAGGEIAVTTAGATGATGAAGGPTSTCVAVGRRITTRRWRRVRPSHHGPSWPLVLVLALLAIGLLAVVARGQRRSPAPPAEQSDVPLRSGSDRGDGGRPQASTAKPLTPPDRRSA